VVEAYLAALNAHDPDAACALVAEDFYNEHISLRGVSFRGRAAYRCRIEAFLESMQGLCYEIEQLLVDGDTVAVGYRMSARWRASGPPAGGAPAGGAPAGEDRPFSIRGMFLFEVQDGQITHRIDYRDGVDFEQQVGLRA
jgi:steroid delta-isomerase-like uncharacterized protein